MNGAGNNSGRSLPVTKEEYMKFTKILGVVAVAALALMAFASTASATTLETNGVTKNAAVTIDATASGSILLQATGGGFANTCTESTVQGTTVTPFTGTTVGGPLSSLTFKKCTNEPVTVDAAGSLTVERIGSTTNGTLRSSGAKVTVPSPFGTLTCTTSNTDVGTLTGTASGTSVVDINGVLNCGFFLPSAQWIGTYNVTGHSLGVVA
jgi:hypothetical protein